MEFAKSGVVDHTNYRDYLSLISSLSRVRNLSLDTDAYECCAGKDVVHYRSIDGKFKLGLGRNFKDSRTFYWVFGEDDLTVSKISNLIVSHLREDTRRN